MMRGMTIHNPWAWAIAYGYKPIENRGTNVNYRGPVAIHAGQRWSDRGGDDPRIRQAAQTARDRGEVRAVLDITRGYADTYGVIVYGAIIAVAQLVNVHPANGCCPPWGDHTYTRGTGVVVPCHHLVLKDVRRLREPVPCRGQQIPLWQVPDDVQAQLEAVSPNPTAPQEVNQ